MNLHLVFGPAVSLAQLALCIIAHECGHLVTAHCHRVTVKRIGIRWMGPYLIRSRTSGWPEISICVAGIAVNLALATAFCRADHWFALCNFTFAWVNLLPIPHSDGRHALDAWRELQAKTKWERFVDQATRWS